MLDLSVDELLYLAEGDDLVVACLGLLLAHSEDGSVEEDVLPA